jgi:putative phosphoribosyl transferase
LTIPFANRAAAGRELAARLEGYRGRNDVIVLGLPRGGVPVAFEVARSLGAPLDVMVVRKLGAPGQPEFAVGAIASGGIAVMNEDVPRWLMDAPGIEHELQVELRELARRERLYRGHRRGQAASGQIVLLVDDGAATGASMLAAVRATRLLQPRSIVVALPVASAPAVASLRAEADEVICISTPEPFVSVGDWYGDFGQTSDEEVAQLLASTAWRQGSADVSAR